MSSNFLNIIKPLTVGLKALTLESCRKYGFAQQPRIPSYKTVYTNQHVIKDIILNIFNKIKSLVIQK